jgi:hypothetical protein
VRSRSKSPPGAGSLSQASLLADGGQGKREGNYELVPVAVLRGNEGLVPLRRVVKVLWADAGSGVCEGTKAVPYGNQGWCANDRYGN